MALIIGTAGHIDHGKSALIRALTGTDPDRLAEEQERGMTIDLGFAFLNEEISFIDVPGHERFVKNMVAGVSTIDVAMLVVAADDGVMPQTREHLDILSLLQLPQGLVVLTKIDLVDEELLSLVRQDVASLTAGTFLQQAPLFPVSTVTGEGIAELRLYLNTLSGRATARPDRGVFWMPIDRSFSMKGFGTVVTGSVLSGRTSAGENLELLPAGRIVKIRGLQTHGHAAQEVRSGQRAALNLQNVEREQVERGNVLATPGHFKSSRLFDVRLQILPSAKKELANRTRVRLHLGTRELMARVKILDQERVAPGRSALVQLILEEPAVAMRRDPFVIRRYSPPLTIGGGVILDAAAFPHRRFDPQVAATLATLEKPDAGEKILAACIANPYTLLSRGELEICAGLDASELTPVLEKLIKDESIRAYQTGEKSAFTSHQNILAIKDRIRSLLETFHAREPLKLGMSRAELRTQLSPALNARFYDILLEELSRDGSIVIQPAGVRLAGHAIRLTEQDEKKAIRVIEQVSRSPFSPPDEAALAAEARLDRADLKRVLGALQGMGRLLRLEGDLFFTPQALEAAEEKLRALGANKPEISVSEFREALGTSRKYAMALLTWFDQRGITERVGDVRMLVKSS